LADWAVAPRESFPRTYSHEKVSGDKKTIVHAKRKGPKWCSREGRGVPVGTQKEKRKATVLFTNKRTEEVDRVSTTEKAARSEIAGILWRARGDQ